MRTLLTATILATALLAAPANGAGWGAPHPIAAGRSVAGLEPTGTTDGYWALVTGPGSADVFELPPLKPAVDLHLIGPATSAAIAGNGKGSVVAVGGGQQLSVIRRTSHGTVTPVTVPGGAALTAAVGRGGDAAIGDWQTFVPAPAGQPFGDTQTVTTARVRAAAAAIAADGTVDFVTATAGHLTLYEQPPGQPLTKQTLAGYPLNGVDAKPAVALAAGRQRSLAVVWTAPASSETSRRRATLLARTRTDAGHLGPVQVLDSSHQPDLSPQVVLTTSGRAIAAWASARGQGVRVVRAAFSARGPGAFGPLSTVSRFGAVRGGVSESISGRDARELSLAAGPRSAALLAWSAGCTNCDTKVEVALARPGRRFATPRVLSRINTLAERPYAAFDGFKGAAVAFTQSDPVTRADQTAVVARAPQLTDTAPRADVHPPRVRVRPRQGGDEVVRTGKLDVRSDCNETCAVQLDLKGEVVAAGTHGSVRMISVPERSQKIAADLRRRGFTWLGWTATDRTGNVSYGRVKLRR